MTQSTSGMSLSKKAKWISEGNVYDENEHWAIPKVAESSATEIYFSKTTLKPESKERSLKTAIVTVVQHQDSQNTALLHVKSGLTPCVLNAANAFDIGGAFERNHGSQEESLFFTTNLYRHLYELGQSLCFSFQVKYNKPLQHKNANSKGPNAIYSKDVWCFQKADTPQNTFRHRYTLCKPFQFNVFTIAGFDLRYIAGDRPLFQANKKFDWELFTAAMQLKYELFFQTAFEQGNTSVVAAALGCGVFKHSGFPEEKTFEAVAIAYARAVKKYQYCFEKIDIVALAPNLAAIFAKKLQENNLPADNALDQLCSNAFYVDEQTMIHDGYKNLVVLLNRYILETSSSSNDNKQKKNIFQDLHHVLTNSNPQNPEQKLIAIHQFKQQLQKIDRGMMSTHRCDQWKRYLSQALSILTVLPLFIRACESYVQYGTFQFWKPKSERNLEGIDSVVTKLNLH